MCHIALNDSLALLTYLTVIFMTFNYYLYRKSCNAANFNKLAYFLYI